MASMPNSPSPSPVLHDLSYFHEETYTKTEPHEGSDFGGYPSLKQRNESFDIKESMTVHCGNKGLTPYSEAKLPIISDPLLTGYLYPNGKSHDWYMLCDRVDPETSRDGNSTRFWLDIWKGEKPFREVYPRLFALERDKEIHVAVKLASLIDSFRRPVRGGVELQQLTDLVSLMDSVVLCSSHDRSRCDLSGDGDFSVKVIRNYIDDKFMPSHSEPSRWVRYIPIKINVFAWRARRDCLPTRVNLMRRGVTLDSVNCPLCNSDEEDIHHSAAGQSVVTAADVAATAGATSSDTSASRTRLLKWHVHGIDQMEPKQSRTRDLPNENSKEASSLTELGASVITNMHTYYT
nr:RNA-directed DNA polymerase, eukaryota [Tanacetum cinerariifolium]